MRRWCYAEPSMSTIAPRIQGHAGTPPSAVGDRGWLLVVVWFVAVDRSVAVVAVRLGQREHGGVGGVGCRGRAGVVDLQGGVGDRVVLGQDLFEVRRRRHGSRRRVDQHVRGERDIAGGDLPDVQVVDLLDRPTATSRSPSASGSRSAGAASRKIRPDSRTRPTPARTISAATTSVAMASARLNPVVSTTSPAMAVAMKPNRSLRMCWKAPSTFRLDRLAWLIAQAAARLTAIPTTAVMSTRPPATSGGSISRRMRLVGQPDRQQQQGQPVGLRGEDLGAFEPVGVVRRAAGRAASRMATRASAIEAASVSMCAASEINASDCATTPTTTSTSMNATIKPRADAQPTPVGLRGHPGPVPVPVPVSPRVVLVVVPVLLLVRVAGAHPHDSILKPSRSCASLHVFGRAYRPHRGGHPHRRVAMLLGESVRSELRPGGGVVSVIGYPVRVTILHGRVDGEPRVVDLTGRLCLPPDPG